MSIPRIVAPEFLDSMPSDDPDAIQSRKDLSLINFFMGNKRWLYKQIKLIGQKEKGRIRIIEVGAGEGRFLEKFLTIPNVSAVGIDRIKRSKNLSNEIDWISKDIRSFDKLPFERNAVNIVVCNLSLHHFTNEEIHKLSLLFDNASYFLFIEPYRHQMPFVLEKIISFFVNHVTFYDMKVSFNAGFKEGEILGFFSSKRMVKESIDPRGVIRWMLSSS